MGLSKRLRVCTEERVAIMCANNCLTHRERVLLALNHQQTDRVPISMIGAAINSPAREELDAYLQQERGMGLAAYPAQAVDLQSQSRRAISGRRFPRARISGGYTVLLCTAGAARMTKSMLIRWPG